MADNIKNINAAAIDEVEFPTCVRLRRGMYISNRNQMVTEIIDNSIDEFINTLGLIFENRIEICTDCNICKIYKNNKSKKTIIKKPIRPRRLCHEDH